jgi:hypothetical protein
MVKTNINLTEYSIPESQFSQLFLERGYTHNYKTRWATNNPAFATLEKMAGFKPVAATIVDEAGSAVLYDLGDRIAILDIDKRQIRVEVAGKNEKGLRSHVEDLLKIFPIPPDSPDKVKVRFWYMSSSGPQNVLRHIVVPNWKSIESNYEKQTLAQLKHLMSEFKPSGGGGQLIVFHGPPGTGKSYSLRALINAWREWCIADYILDPENLFGGNQGYMASLVLRGASDEYEFDEDEDAAVPVSTDKWKLLILEDSGELLSADAKMRSGQGLSRLLNLVDGLIGQGLRVLVLITTNEDFNKLHEAVSREGRCAAAVKFRPFDYAGAMTWLENNSGDLSIMPVEKKSNEYTLADLYGQLRGGSDEDRALGVDTKAFGFRMP